MDDPAVAPGAIVLGTSLDPYATDDPTHLEYHGADRVRGRRAGHVMLKVRTKRSIGPRLDYLFSSFAGLSDLAERTRWKARMTAADDVRYLAAFELRA